ncbi:MAG: ABC transporter substrate-binding protein [Actinomycetia bacterium]|nr:ABC transporter substrate-binding protein [Actinomycetes bacterium]
MISPKLTRRGLFAATGGALILAACSDDSTESSDTKPSTGDSTGDTPGSGAEQAGGTEPYEVVVAISRDPEQLDPHKTGDNAEFIWNNVYEPLYRRSVDGSEVLPLLAAELPTQIDDTTWEIPLNPDARFASGDPVTAADVAYTIESIVHNDLVLSIGDRLEGIASAEAVDDLTVRMTTKTVDPIFLSRLTYGLIVQEGQREVEGWPQSGHNGSGAYTFDSWEPGSQVHLTRRDDYWGEDVSAAPSTVVVRIIPDKATQLLSLENNELDIVPELSPDQARTAPVSARVSGTDSTLIRTNTLNGRPLATPELREAGSLAIDRQAIVDVLFEGDATVAECQIAPATEFGHTVGLGEAEYDPDRARELVAEFYDGTPLSFIAGAGFSPKHSDVAQAVAQNLQDVGFNIDLQITDSREVLAAQFGSKDGFADLLLWTTNAELFEAIQSMQWVRGDHGFSAVQNDVVDAAVAEVLSTTDVAARQAAYDTINRTTCEEHLNYYLYYLDDFYGISEDIAWTPRAEGWIILKDIRPA